MRRTGYVYLKKLSKAFNLRKKRELTKNIYRKFRKRERMLMIHKWKNGGA